MVLLIAMIMLIAMTLSGLAMLRTIGAGSMIAGNLAFKQNATSIGDLGVESARSWMVAKGLVSPSALDTDLNAQGYYSSWQGGFNPLTYDWSNSTLVTADEGSGNEVRYVLHRLCMTSGLSVNDPLQQCATLTTAGQTSTKGGGAYGSAPLGSTIQPYYRVTSKIKGPRNTVSYVQVVMY